MLSKSKSDTNNLTSILKLDLFSSISEKDLISIFSEVNIRESLFRKGDILAMQGELCNRLILLIKGEVEAEMIDPSGRIVKVEDIKAPSPLAILFLFGSNNRFPVQVTAKKDVTTLIIPKQSILKMLQLNEQLLHNYLNISAHYASTLSKKLHLMSFRTIRQKIAIYLLDLPSGNDSTILLDQTHATLAEYFGVSRPSLTRELHNMQKDGILAIDGKRIKIIDKDTLIQLIRFS